MRQAREILGRAMRRLARPGQPLEWLTAVWPLVMGKRLAGHTRPLTWNEGVLEIGVAGAAWQEQLEEMAGTLRREINRWWGSELVRQVTFTQESSSGTSDPATKPPVRLETSEAHTPFIRRGWQRRKAK